MLKYLVRITPCLIKYKLYQYKLMKHAPQPVLFNFSVTNHCQSQCKTCNIWKLYRDQPEKAAEELTLGEIEQVFSTMNPILLLNICGGEPSLREDLPLICEIACRTLKPQIIHFPTNCLAPEKIFSVTEGILKKIPRTTKLTVKLSIDGIGKDHDKIRGVEGNFQCVMETYHKLLPLKLKYKNFYLDAGITVGNNNIDKVKEVGDWIAKNMKVDSFLHEIADLRGELFNKNDNNIRPSAKLYRQALKILKDEVARSAKKKRFLSKMTQALRLSYYQRAAKVLRKERRAVHCFAAVSNCHLNPWGGVWPCNIQAFERELGNVKDFNFDFQKLWHSVRADKIRQWINEEHCYCPLVGQAFLDTMLSPLEAFRTLYYFVKLSL